MKEIKSYIKDKSEELYIINCFNIDSSNQTHEYLSYENDNNNIYKIIFGNSNCIDQNNSITKKFSDKMYSKKLTNYEMIKSTVLEFFTYFTKDYKKKNKDVDIYNKNIDYERQILPSKELLICWLKYNKRIMICYFSRKQNQFIYINCGKYASSYIDAVMEINISPVSWGNNKKLITIDDNTLNILENFVDFLKNTNKFKTTLLIRYK